MQMVLKERLTGFTGQLPELPLVRTEEAGALLSVTKPTRGTGEPRKGSSLGGRGAGGGGLQEQEHKEKEV